MSGQLLVDLAGLESGDDPYLVSGGHLLARVVRHRLPQLVRLIVDGLVSLLRRIHLVAEVCPVRAGGGFD